MMPRMGFGWLLSSPDHILLTFSGKLEKWASSTKAESFAIFNILLICPYSSKVNILKLEVSLEKVKAHSNNFYNDQADDLAIKGASENITCDINHKGLSYQNGSLIFNDELAIDRNIRRTLLKPLQYRQFEIHLSHDSLHLIREFTLDNLINWEFTHF
jgi:hypothetical protein